MFDNKTLNNLQNNDSNLTFVEIRQKKLSIDDIKQLGEIFNNNNVVDHLILHVHEFLKTSISDFVQAISKISYLEFGSLTYKQCEAASDFIAGIIKQHKNLKSLKMNVCSPKCVEKIAIALRDNKSLIKLDLCVSNIEPISQVLKEGSCSQLKELEIKISDVKGNFLDLADCKSLTSLSIKRGMQVPENVNDIVKGLATALLRNENLKELSLECFNQGVLVALMGALIFNKSIEKFSWKSPWEESPNKKTDEIINAFFEQNKILVNLDLDHYLSAENIDSLSKNVTLKELSLKINVVMEEKSKKQKSLLNYLAKNKSLKRLNVFIVNKFALHRETVLMAELGEALSQNKSLEEFELKIADCEQLDSVSLIKNLEDNTALKKLSIPFPESEKQIIESFLYLLKKNRTLIEINSTSSTEYAGSLLSRLFEFNRELKQCYDNIKTSTIEIEKKMESSRLNTEVMKFFYTSFQKIVFLVKNKYPNYIDLYQRLFQLLIQYCSCFENIQDIWFIYRQLPKEAMVDPEICQSLAHFLFNIDIQGCFDKKYEKYQLILILMLRGILSDEVDIANLTIVKSFYAYQEYLRDDNAKVEGMKKIQELTNKDTIITITMCSKITASENKLINEQLSSEELSEEQKNELVKRIQFFKLLQLGDDDNPLCKSKVVRFNKYAFLEDLILRPARYPLKENDEFANLPVGFSEEINRLQTMLFKKMDDIYLGEIEQMLLKPADDSKKEFGIENEDYIACRANLQLEKLVSNDENKKLATQFVLYAGRFMKKMDDKFSKMNERADQLAKKINAVEQANKVLSKKHDITHEEEGSELKRQRTLR